MDNGAAPGVTCFIVRDEIANGRNLGKLCLVAKQCCIQSAWKVEALESTWLQVTVFGLDVLRQFPAGTIYCVPKRCVRPLQEPPEEREPDPVLQPIEDDITARTYGDFMASALCAGCHILGG